VGEIAVAKPPGEALPPAEDRLLTDLAAQAGPALSSARLTVELRARLAELAEQAAALQASRQRLVAARDAARRKLERDLHDGAQQHLVALAVTLSMARQLARGGPERVSRLLDESAAQAEAALTTLRDLARGVFPPLLADRGLAAALEARRGRACPGATLEAGPDVAGARYAPEVEAGVYFCCLEALQNAAKHAPGAPVRVRLSSEHGWLAFAVQDEGPGFDPGAAPPGAGLLNMADRMGALGGALTVQTAPGAGTTVSGRAPLRRGTAAPPAGLAGTGRAAASASA
jgi:signal transduction histidine kinase